MTYIKNTKYITINKDGVFVGGKPATTYRGEEILLLNDVRKNFADIRRLNETVAELHVLSSKTCGVYAKAGNPSAETGPNVWCRVKFTSGYIGSWVFGRTSSSAAVCAHLCARYCAGIVRGNADFRSAVFDAVDKEKTQTPINPVVVAANNEAQNKR